MLARKKQPKKQSYGVLIIFELDQPVKIKWLEQEQKVVGDVLN